MLMQNFGVTNKEHYGMLWYSWSGQLSTKRNSVSVESQKLQHGQSLVFLGATNNLKADLAKDNLTTGLVTTVRDHVRCSKSEGESDLIDRFLMMLRNGAF